MWGRCRRLLQPQRHDGTQRAELENAHTVVHEYGHHLDRSTPVAGIAEPNGTSVWWRARGMAQLLRLGSVARSYVIGWNRSIGEIFAEDYAQLALPGSPHQIPWLGSPNDTVIAALKADLGLGPEPEIVALPRCRSRSSGRGAALSPPGSAWRFRSDCSGPAATCR